jgi:type IV secretory pathway VirB10-like protein
MQVLLDRASILSGAEEPLVTFDVNGKTLGFLADYPQGAVDEEMELKVSMDKAEAIFPAPLIRRALGQTKTFALSPSGLVMAGGDEFTYILAPHTKAEKKTKKVTKKPADEEDGEKKTTRRKPREQEEDPPEEAEKPTRRGRSEPKEEGEEEPRRRPSRDKDEPAEERPRRRSRRDDDEIPF